MPTKFKNEPLTDWSKLANRKKQEAEMAKLRASLGKSYPKISNGEKRTGRPTFASFNPSNAAETVGTFQLGIADDAVEALNAAWKAFETWKDVPPAKRAAYIFKAAKI